MDTEIKRVKIQTPYVYGEEGYLLTKWDLRFMKLADEEVAQWSKDRSRKIGAVIVRDRELISTGFNSGLEFYLYNANPATAEINNWTGALYVYFELYTIN